MAFLLKGGAVFLHIPKTGGSWVKAVLKESGLIEKQLGHEHANWDRVLFRDRYYDLGLKEIIKTKVKNRFIGKLSHGDCSKETNDKNPFVFCFVRQPLTWYESWWKYMVKMKWKDWGRINSKRYWHPNAVLNGLGSDDFNQFVKNVICTKPGYVSELYGSYTQPGINFIGKTENIVDDLIKVLQFLELDYNEDFIRTYKKVNVSHSSSTIEWEAELKEMALKMELPALVQYGYAEEPIYTELATAIGVTPTHKALQKILL